MSIAANCCHIFKQEQPHRQDVKAANGHLVLCGGSSYIKAEKYLTVSLENE